MKTVEAVSLWGVVWDARSVQFDVAAEIQPHVYFRSVHARPVHARRDHAAEWRSGLRPEHRSGQTGPATIRRQLRGLSPQRARPRQGPLPPPAVPVPATALRGQFQLGLGADFLSGIPRHAAATRPSTNDRSETVIRRITVVATAARAGA